MNAVMSYMDPVAVVPANDIQELSFDETEAVSGGLIWFVVAFAAGAVASTAVVGFIDGMIEGFQDDK